MRFLEQLEEHIWETDILKVPFHTRHVPMGAGIAIQGNLRRQFPRLEAQ